jgi:hypothetical protein
MLTAYFTFVTVALFASLAAVVVSSVASVRP